MNKRKFLNMGVMGILLVGLTFSQASAFGLKSITDAVGGGGSSGGASWSAIAEKFTGSLKDLGKQAAVVGSVYVDLASALEDKKMVALLNKEKKCLEENNCSNASLDAITSAGDGVTKLRQEKKAAGVKLSVEQKKKMAKAAIKYGPALIKAIKATKQLSEVGDDASKAGTPGISDGTAAISAAKDIPVLVPAAVSFMGKSITTGQKLFEIMRENDIAVSDKDMKEMAAF